MWFDIAQILSLVRLEWDPSHFLFFLDQDRDPTQPDHSMRLIHEFFIFH
jgi:hypothetical protein